MDDDDVQIVLMALGLDFLTFLFIVVGTWVAFYLFRRAHRRLLSSLPKFTFSPTTHPDPVDCVICLSGFEDGETGRILPQCEHIFHSDCIDTWLLFRRTCPLCRTAVEPAAPELVPTRPGEAEPEGVYNPLPSMVGVTVEVPGRNDSFSGELPSSSPPSWFGSVMSRVRLLRGRNSVQREERESLVSANKMFIAFLDRK